MADIKTISITDCNYIWYFVYLWCLQIDAKSQFWHHSLDTQEWEMKNGNNSKASLFFNHKAVTYLVNPISPDDWHTFSKHKEVWMEHICKTNIMGC